MAEAWAWGREQRTEEVSYPQQDEVAEEAMSAPTRTGAARAWVAEQGTEEVSYPQHEGLGEEAVAMEMSTRTREGSRARPGAANWAFCYSHLELHKHVVKDCDRALQLDPALLQAYVLKDKKEDALLVWKQGYEIAVRDTTDLKQLLELEELVSSVKICETTESPDHVMDASPCDTKVVISEDRVVDKSATATTMADTKTVVCEEAIGNSKVSSNGDAKLPNHNNKVENNKVSTSPVKDSTGNQAPKKPAKQDKENKAKAVKEINGRAEGAANRTSSDESETTSLEQTLFATKISKSSKSISLDFRLSRGIAQVNEGRYDQAISIFDQILRETPTYPEALIGRGTAYAFQRELDSAISDFTKAIQSNPSAGEAWKRWGQARAALGEFKESMPSTHYSDSISCPVIGIVNFKFKDYNSALEDLSTCVKRDKKNSSAHTYLGLTLSVLGEYKRAEDEHLVGIKYDESFLDCWAHLAQIKDYDDVLDLELDSMDKFVLQCLAFYQKEMALYIASKANLEFSQFNIDDDVDPLFKYRMAGLAAIEIAQKVSKAWRFPRNPKNIAKLVRRRDKLNMSQNRGGYCSTSTLSGSPTSSPNEDRVFSGISLSWQDVYNIAVKWRQISEPCDPVVWVNKLSEEFNSGFGSHTPMLLGQAKVVRYYPYYQRVLEAAKNIMLDLKYVNNAEDRAIFLTDIEKLKKIEVASSCSDLYHVVGETYWVATRCDSMAFQGGKTGFDFAIRTPCTPSRWEEYDEEMTAAWEAICEAYCNDTNPTRDPGTLDAVKDAILRE
ncbi:tetratricopeptide repeat(TPR)-containing protein-like [Panicum miliaceum]|uniref:Tetratricopeptide repeat(TPR)-containing protein-like n=1 Tax=Panicum miliaceum TaxID=4540 RepID=A0A3L6QR96_PANMI|nr:tetratricopeptide repeat(TPR)-containing protein-like [Panicum miliaceum]